MKDGGINIEDAISPAQRRRNRAEESGRVSISDWLGELHAHTKDEPAEMTPEKIARERLGSNCGHIPLAIMLSYHLDSLKNEYLAVTDHSRDGRPDRALPGVTEWFRNLYLEQSGKKEEELTPDERTEYDKAGQYAKELLYYGDERLKNNLDNMGARTENQVRLIKGVEVSLRPDGSFDSDLAQKGAFDQVICSIHPETDENGFSDIINDPAKYSQLVIKGLENPQTNIFGHLGKFSPNLDLRQLDWDRIAQAAIKNRVALEINLEDLIKYINNQILPDNEFAGWAKYDKFKTLLPKLVPIISSPAIKEKLRPYVKKGLAFAINTDEHKNPFIKQTDNGVEFKREMRYWRALKVVESYFNEVFLDLGVKNNNIINTFSLEKLKNFLEKKLNYEQTNSSDI